MSGFVVVEVSHAFIMHNDDVIGMVKNYLSHGSMETIVVERTTSSSHGSNRSRAVTFGELSQINKS